MLSPFICGSGTFHEEQEDDEPWSTPCSSPKKSRTRKSKNPYSTRGLDKFSALVADLEEKRQKIYSQLGSQDISLVRFVYSNSNDCVPIVVKLKDKKGQEKTKNGRDMKDNQETPDKSQAESPTAVQEAKKEQKSEPEKKAKKRSFSWNSEMGRWRRPAYYLPAAIILILVFLAVFGRSAAVLCTSLGWYLVPTLPGESSNVMKRSMKKKQYVRELSENKMVKSACSSPPNGASPRQHGHRKSF